MNAGQNHRGDELADHGRNQSAQKREPEIFYINGVNEFAGQPEHQGAREEMCESQREDHHEAGERCQQDVQKRADVMIQE